MNNTDRREDQARWFDNMARPIYGAHARNRLYAVDADARRGLAATRKACREQAGDDKEKADKLFAETLDGLSGVGVNVYQDEPKAAPKVPELWIPNEPPKRIHL